MTTRKKYNIMKPLTNKDYVNILKYYKISSKKNKTKNKKLVENILINKLCRCIKKVSKKNTNSNTIGICNNSIFTKKKIKYFKFKCKKKQMFLPIKNKTYKLYK